ncbi:MAG: KpsF/GutQ family sugar-phosphate isomerase [Desulfobacterales bacterium]|jgi:arabinose-5-phosphate isomerase
MPQEKTHPVSHTHAASVLERAKAVLRAEADGILCVAERIDQRFDDAVNLIAGSRGRLVLSGIGKSGLIGRKMAATFNSTGTRALFLHPVEAMHGDLGVVTADDVFAALSNSGETEELNLLLPSIKQIGCPVIVFTGNPASTLASHSDILIDVGVEQEACPMGLAPTTSSTALLAVGDALAVVLMDRNHFNTSDFKRFHPGGALGQRLCQRVADIMITGESLPTAAAGIPMSAALRAMDDGGLGALLITGPGGTLTGIITDGDLRRSIASGQPTLSLTVDDIMTPSPKSLRPDSPAYDALNMMENHQITVLPITEPDGRIAGILHLHDILGKGAFKFNGH